MKMINDPIIILVLFVCAFFLLHKICVHPSNKVLVPDIGTKDIQSEKYDPDFMKTVRYTQLIQRIKQNMDIDE